MISALLYLQYHTVKNRLLMRFKRLKQPKYLIGAIVGGLYFYFYFFHWLFSRTGRPPMAASAATPGDPVLGESIGALALLAFALLAWVVPHKRAALAFTEAEVAFLFPAPVTRRGLIHFKLLRSQFAILLTTLFLTLVSFRFSHGRVLTHVAGWWLILSTLNLHTLGASFVLTMLLDRGVSNWKRRVAVLALVLAALGVVGTWAVREIPGLTSASLENLDSIKGYAKQVLVSGPLPYLLFPFRLVVRPYLAADWLAFWVALGPALLLMAVHYWWVMRSDVAFEEASVEASKTLAEKVAAMRTGNWRTAGRKLKVRRAPFVLRSAGPPLMALLWKNLISAGGAFTARAWISVLIIVIGLSAAFGSAGGASNWRFIVAMIAGSIATWMLLFGPQIMRQDFRQDLPNADVLKVFPLSGWQIALGEILAPTVILTGVQWLLLIVAAVCGASVAHGKISAALVLALGAGAGVMLPMLNLLSLLIPNAAVLLFPAWFQTSKEGPHGIEATGQRIIFALGQFLAFIVALIPAAAVFAGFFFLVKFVSGVVLAVPVAALAATLVLAVEAGLGVMLLGWLFERFDLSTEQTT